MLEYPTQSHPAFDTENPTHRGQMAFLYQMSLLPITCYLQWFIYSITEVYIYIHLLRLEWRRNMHALLIHRI